MTDAVNTVKVKVNTATLDNSDQLELDLEDGYVTIGSNDDYVYGVKLATEGIIEDLKTKHTGDVTNLQAQIFNLDSNVVHKYNEFANDVPYFEESIYGGKNFYGTTTFNNYITITNTGHLTVDSNTYFSKVPTTIIPAPDSNDESIPNTEWVNNLVSNTDAELKTYIGDAILDLKLDDTFVHKTGDKAKGEVIEGDKTFKGIVSFDVNPMTIAPSDDSDNNSIPNTEWVNKKIKNTQNDFELNPYSTAGCQHLTKDQICTWFDPDDGMQKVESINKWSASDNGYIKFRFNGNDETNNNKVYLVDVTKITIENIAEKLPKDDRAILFAINEGDGDGNGFDSTRSFYYTSIQR